ncbi:MAG: CsgG/HfaB family protein [Deltaproteobacteria bacterium]|nr:CsgG/HfaB family protein [Deltaproteobacteria bacterium]
MKRYLILPLLGLFLAGTIPLPAATLTEEILVSGYGRSQDQAVTKALVEAVRQAFGLSLDSEEMGALAAFSSDERVRDGAGETSVNVQHLREAMQSSVSMKSKGTISSYRVLSSDKTEDGGYEVSLRVVFDKYVIPGVGDTRRRIAVIGIRADRAGAAGVPGPEELADALTQEFVAKFTATRKFSVLDRDNEFAYALEKELLQSDDAARGETAKLGNVYGADYILTGGIKNLNIADVKRSIQISGAVVSGKTAEADIEYRLLTFANRQVKMASTIHVSLPQAEIRSLSGAQIANRIISQGVEQIVNACLESIYPPQIVSRSGNRITLNLGGESVAKGQYFTVYQLGEELFDPYTKESLGAEEEEIAVVRAVDVKPKVSVAEIVSGRSSEVEVGQICRKREAPAAAKPAGPARKPQQRNLNDEW